MDFLINSTKYLWRQQHKFYINSSRNLKNQKIANWLYEISINSTKLQVNTKNHESHNKSFLNIFTNFYLI